MSLSEDQAKALQAAVSKLKEDPTLIYDPEFAPFKEFLFSWGAKVPAAKSKSAEAAPETAKPAAAPKPAAAAPAPAPEPEEEEEEEEEPEEPEGEDPERLPEDPEPYPERGPKGELELTDEQMDAQAAAKQAAVEALEDGDMEKALAKYTEAFKIGNVSAMMYAKRGELLLKMKRPMACIADCTAALAVNPDSGKALKTRGKAHRKLGHWEEAHKDLAGGQKIDYDSDTGDIQKFVQGRYAKIAERQNRRRIREERIAKKKKEADYKRRKAQAQQEYEEAKVREKAEQEQYAGMGGMGGGFPGMPGGMPGMPPGVDPSMMQGLMSDPELLAALQNPKMAAAMQDIMSNPANLAKYQSDPEIMGLVNKMMGKMGAAGGMTGGGMPGGGMPGGGGGGGYPTSGDSGGGSGPSAGPSVEEVDD